MTAQVMSTNAAFLSQLPLDYILNALDPKLVDTVKEQVVAHQKEQQRILEAQELQRKVNLLTKIIQEAKTPLGIFTKCKETEDREFIEWALYNRSFESFVQLIIEVRGLNLDQDSSTTTLLEIANISNDKEPLYVRLLSLLKANPQGLTTVQMEPIIGATKQGMRRALERLINDNLVSKTTLTVKHSKGANKTALYKTL